MGRHSAEFTGLRGRTTMALIAAAVLVVGGAATGWALMRDRDAQDVTSMLQSSQSASTTSSSTTISPTTSSASSTTDETAARAALAACAKEVKAGETVAARAAVSASHWATHTTAQIKFDNGDYTLEQTKAAWAASKATGTQDVARFKAAEKAYKSVDGACAKVGEATRGTDLAAGRRTARPGRQHWRESTGPEPSSTASGRPTST